MPVAVHRTKPRARFLQLCHAIGYKIACKTGRHPDIDRTPPRMENNDMRTSITLTLAIATIAALGGCGKKPASGGADASATVAPAAAPATPAPPPAPAEDPEIAARRKAMEIALAEQKIADDPMGQWAVDAKASSTYQDASDQTAYSAWQATGAPNVSRYGDDGNSWATKESDAGIEWLQVTFAKPVRATEIRIRQNNAPGSIVKVELIDDQNAAHTVFEGMDDTKYPENTIAWFIRAFNSTEYKVTGARITLATNMVQGWNEIDAVQLLGE